MELNPKASLSKNSLPKDMVVNPEGAVVWKDDVFRAAILSGMSLNLRPRRTFYYTDEERFQSFLETLEEVYKQDPEFLEALVPYLRFEHGRKLSPMAVIGFLLAKKSDWKHLPNFISARIIDTPKRMAEAVAVYKQLAGVKSFASIPYKGLFKAVLESYDEYTLKKNRMRRRKIKLADLIKVFRPRPTSEERSRLYKTIIENDPYASLKKDEHITATLSSTELSDKEKKEILEDQIDKIPFNALVRNLSQFADSDFEVKLKIRERFKSVLEALKKEDSRALAVVNPFDLLALPRSDSWKKFGALQDVVKEMVDCYVSYWANRLGTKEKKAAVLLDVSGSMDGYGITRAVEFLAVIGGLYTVVELGAFTSKLYLSKIEPPGLYGKHWPTIDLEEIKDMIARTESVFMLSQFLHERFHGTPHNGTALVDAYKDFTRHIPDADLYIIISDEITRDDRENRTWELEYLPNKAKQKVAICNVAYMGTKGGVVIKHPQVLRISELTPGLFSYLELWDGDIRRLVERIKEKYLK